MSDELDFDSSEVHAQVRKWCGRIELARKREKEWRKLARRCLEIYEGDKCHEVPFNILYSNTETLSPALYTRAPRPVVDRRFRDKDPMGKVVAQAVKRGLEFAVDTGDTEYQPFHEALSDAVLDALVPGRAVTRLRYDAEVEKGGVRYEKVCFESIEWDRFYFGFAKKWCDVPWVAFEGYLDKAAVKKRFGAAIANDMKYSVQGTEKNDEGKDKDSADPKTDVKTACMYEIWEKRSRKVIWISPDYKKGVVEAEKDELGLVGFFPIPEPLRLLRKANNLLPTPLYQQYENQAKELNRITLRLNRLIEACKVRGIYNGIIPELEEVFKQEENGLVPAQNVQGLENGIEKNLWMIPLDKIQQTIQQLYVARENCKQVIYEITGISDILRGSTKASETLGAQKIKESWGTMRLKRMQGDVQEYVRETLRIAAEIEAKHFSEETWAAMTQMELPTAEAVAQAEQVTQQAQLLASLGAPPLPQAQEAAALLAGPTWPKVMEVLQNDLLRQYKIDIETNSTIEPEATEDREQIAEVTNAISQFLNGVGPLVESGAMSFDIAREMLLTIVRRFRFGPELEDAIMNMQPPQPQPDPNAQAKVETEKAKLQLEAQKHQQEMAMAQQEMEFKKQEHQLRMMELQAKIQVQEMLGRMKVQQAGVQAQVTAQQGQMKLEQSREQGELKLQQQAAQAKAAARAKPKEKPRANV